MKMIFLCLKSDDAAAVAAQHVESASVVEDYQHLYIRNQVAHFIFGFGIRDLDGGDGSDHL